MSNQPTIAPYGAWKSPITTKMLTDASIGLGSPGVDGENLLWVEMLPQEGGRGTLVRRRAGETEATELTPAPFNVRTRVHEYGGAPWASKNDIVIFSNFADNRLYRIDADDAPYPITPEGGFRYADLQIDLANNRILAVREDHSVPEAEAVNTIVSLSLDGPNEDGGKIVVSGTDFIAAPRLSDDGTKLAWTSWNHPMMPWDAAEIRSGQIDAEGALSRTHEVAGGWGDAAAQPHWLPDGTLTFVAERTGWWNLYRERQDTEVMPLHPAEAEYGAPDWVFGVSTFDVAGNNTLVTAWTENGEWSLGKLDIASGYVERFDLPYTSIGSVHAQPETGSVIFIAGSSTLPSEIVRLDLETGQYETIRKSRELTIDPGYLSIPQSLTWKSEDGSDVHGFYYPPTNKDFVAPEGELPPVIVQSHGGPTGATSSAFSLTMQYWTSRGFAILDVNYGGSTGYGRAYRERLRDKWGIVDIDDCVSGVHHLVATGKADPKRLIIRGGSAGGYTTLAALTFRNVFSAGTSYFGVGDLEALAKETHKFESRYLDGLVGPYPQAIDIYTARSPIHHTDQLSSAMILFQGLDDKVVPPNQAQDMADAVREKGLPVAHFTYEGEGHGFRKAENIQLTAERELSFYAQLFGFTPADDIPPIAIDNLSAAS